MLLGVVAAAAGVEISIEHATEHLEPGPALALGGGVALFLAGAAAFRAVASRPGRALLTV